MTSTTKLTGHDAIEYAATHGIPLSSYTTPIEPAHDGDLSLDLAREIAAADPSLVYVEVSGTTYPQHAVVQLDTGAIYGVGEDLAHARADAREGFRRAHVEDIDAEMEHLSDARISDAAAQYVLDYGGGPDRKIAFGRVPGSHVVAIHLRSECEGD